MKPLKTKAREWLNSLYEEYTLDEKKKELHNCSFYFKLEGFADEPQVYLRPTNEGLEFGYEAIQWEGYMPSPIPGVYKKHLLLWETLRSITKEKQHEIILELLLKLLTREKDNIEVANSAKKKSQLNIVLIKIHAIVALA